MIEIPKVFQPLDEAHRYKVMYGGRGSSKSWSVARKLILRAVENKILILCTRELQKSVKQSVHRLIKNQISALGLSGFFEMTDHSIRLSKQQSAKAIEIGGTLSKGVRTAINKYHKPKWSEPNE